MRVSKALQIKATPKKPKQSTVATRTKRVLGNVTNFKGGKMGFSTNDKKPPSSSVVVKLDKANEPPAKASSTEEPPKQAASVRFEEEANDVQEEQPTWKATIFPNVHWRSVKGTIKMTDRNIMFHPEEPSAIKPKKLDWKKVEKHGTKTIPATEQGDGTKYLLRMVPKNPSSAPIVLRFESEGTRNQVDREMARHVQQPQQFQQPHQGTTNTTTTSSSASSGASAYYPIVRLISNSNSNSNSNTNQLQGSLSLTNDYLVFEPAVTHHHMPSAMIKIRWSKIRKHQLNCRTTKALMKIICSNSPSNKPVVFQLSTRQELKRLNRDMLSRLQTVREKSDNQNAAASAAMQPHDVVVKVHQIKNENDNDMAPTKPLRPALLRPCLLDPAQPFLASPRDNTSKKVKFQLPKQETAPIMDFTTPGTNDEVSQGTITLEKNKISSSSSMGVYHRMRNGFMAFLSLSLVLFNVALITDTLDIGTEARRLMHTIQLHTESWYSSSDLPLLNVNSIPMDQVDMGKVEELFRGLQKEWDQIDATSSDDVQEEASDKLSFANNNSNDDEEASSAVSVKKPSFVFEVIRQAGTAHWWN